MADFPRNRRLAIVAAVIVAASPLAPGRAALAQSPTRTIIQLCLPHAQIEEKLLSDFQERKLGHGISADGHLLEIFMAPSGTFSVVKTSPRGVSCVVDFGEGWQTFHPLEQVGFPPEDLKVEPAPF